MNTRVAYDLAIFIVFVLVGVLFASGFIALANDFKEVIAPLFNEVI